MAHRDRRDDAGTNTIATLSVSRLEDDLRVTAFQLTNHLGHFLIERELLFTIVRALAQHERLDDGPQNILGQLRMRYDDGLTGGRREVLGNIAHGV